MLERIGAATPDLIYAKDREGRMIFANPAVLQVIGLPWDAIKGRLDSEWHPDIAEANRFMETDARIMAQGELENLEETLTGPLGRQTYLSTKSPLRDEEGEVIGIFGISMNISERKAEEAHQKFLMEEMNHRVKNTLATVQAMARQTLKKSGISSGVWDSFEGRLIAMSTAHELLTREKWVGADVATIVGKALRVHQSGAGDVFAIDGPAVLVDAQTALALAMALHELGTNAMKYGALSVPLGRVSIRWMIDNDARGHVLDFRWNESGGPPVEPPASRGFGSRLIKQAFSHHGDNSAEIDFLPQGVEFRTRIVLSSAAGAESPEAAGH